MYNKSVMLMNNRSENSFFTLYIIFNYVLDSYQSILMYNTSKKVIFTDK